MVGVPLVMRRAAGNGPGSSAGTTKTSGPRPVPFGVETESRPENAAVGGSDTTNFDGVALVTAANC